MMMTLLTLQQFYDEIITLQKHSVYNVLNGHSKVHAIPYFRNLFNSFINILAILQDFNGIFSKHSLNITVLRGFCYCKQFHKRSLHFTWTSFV